MKKWSGKRAPCCYGLIIGMLLVLAVVLFTVRRNLSSQATYDQDPNHHVTVTAYNINQAKQLIEDTEYECALMLNAETVSREEFEAFVSRQAFYGRGKTTPTVMDERWGTCFFDLETYQDLQVDPIPVRQDIFYPTLLHEDVEITEAWLEDASSDCSCMVIDYLRIRVAYTGQDVALKDWYREYVFQKFDGKWRLYLVRDQQTLEGEDFYPQYLPLRVSLDETQERGT